MPNPYLRERREGRELPFTPERILELARRPEGFRVSWRWRDEWLAHRCAKLVRAGKLRRIRRHEKGAYFYGPPLPAEPNALTCPSLDCGTLAAPSLATPSLAFDESLFG